MPIANRQQKTFKRSIVQNRLCDVTHKTSFVRQIHFRYHYRDYHFIKRNIDKFHMISHTILIGSLRVSNYAIESTMLGARLTDES